MLFALLGLGGGTAQAWPWDVGDDITAFITNFCNPEDVPAPNTYYGIDTVFGLNEHPSSNRRGTVVPNVSQDLAGQSGPAMDRIQQAYGSNPAVVHPTYERYGFETLQWTNFGGGCFSVGHWFSSINNFALTALVKIPMILGMATLHFAMDNVLYDVFAVLISPLVNVFTTIFTPWVYFIAPLGVLWVWMQSKGSLQQTLKAFVWVVCIFGVFLWMGNNTSTLVTKMNNFVTAFAGDAACKISEVSGSGSSCNANDPMAGIMQSLWYGVPYQTWLYGQVGSQQADADKRAEANNQMGIGPAILNGLYVNPDDKAGQSVFRAIEDWNSRSYSPDGDDTKTALWTGSYENAPWRHIPLLTAVKFICNDTVQGGESSGEPADNKWFYGGSCDSAGAGTTSMVPYFTGQAYAQQLVVAFSGGVAALAVLLAIGGCAIYLALQKMLFYFLLAFGPIFLAISTFADEKRRRFATRYFEMLAANVIKQCVAVCAVLFVSYSMATLLFPPPGSGLPDIPWLAKPFFAILFFIALLLFAVPMKNIMTGAVAGDTSVVDKTAHAPASAAKGAGKVGLAAGALAATGGMSGGAMGGGKGASMLTQAGRAMGTQGGTGKALHVAGRGMHMAQAAGEARAQKQGKGKATAAGAEMLLSGPGGDKYEQDKDGKVTAAGMKAARADFERMSQQGMKDDKSQKIQDTHMAQAFRGYRAQTGQHHPSDPSSPENKRNAAVSAEQERKQVREQSNHASARANSLTGESRSASSNFAGHSNGDGGVPSTGETQALFAGQAREVVSGPEFGRNQDIRANMVTSGGDVLQQVGLSQADVAADPTQLLTGQAYGGGDTTRMDPAHSATEPLTHLRMAMATGDEQAISRAAAPAMAAVQEHGAPPEINGIRAYGDAARRFESTNVVGAMPRLNEDSSWEDRASGAVTMQAAVAQMPADHAASDQVQAYVEALATPSVSMTAVDGLKAGAIQAIDSADQTSTSLQATPDTPGPAPAANTSHQDGNGQSTQGWSESTYLSPQQSGPPSEQQEAYDAPNSGHLGRADMVDAVREGVREASWDTPAASHSAGNVVPPVEHRSSPSGPEPSAVEPPESEGEQVRPASSHEEPAVYRVPKRARRSGLYYYDDEDDESGEEGEQ